MKAQVLPNYAFFGGRIIPYSEAKVGILTHALNYGTAVFGGLRAYWNEEEKQLFVFRPQDHFKRFPVGAIALHGASLFGGRFSQHTLRS